MVAIVSGNNLGLSLTSRASLGQQGTFGLAGQGQNGEQAFVNLANGNFVLQRHDDFLASTGQDVDIVRTYNSLGTDNWSYGTQRKHLTISMGATDALSTIRRTDDDGAQATYRFDSGKGAFVSDDGAGAYDTVKNVNGTWIWTDGDSGLQENYSAAGLLTSVRDTSGNVTSYAYTNGKLSSIGDASGETTYYDYAGGNVSQIRVVGQGGSTTTRVHYGYDANNRLSTVRVDLSPNDNSISDNRSYVTTYTYEGTSNRISSILQGDGTSLAITYIQVGTDWRVATVTDGAAHTTSYNYDVATRRTTVTDPTGVVSRFTYDQLGQLTLIQNGLLSGGQTSLSELAYSYNAQGDITASRDGAGNTINYQYDNNGNQIFAADTLGRTTQRTFDSRNQILTETVSGAGGLALTSRNVYDASGRNQLRFSISAQGRVTEYRYDIHGLRVSTIEYAGGTVDLSGFSSTGAPSEAQMRAWVDTQDLTRSIRKDASYDFRGQLSSTITYDSVDSQGNGVQATSTLYVYSHAGELLQTVQPNIASTSQYVYDGLGRVIVRTSPSSDGNTANTTVNDYADGLNKVTTTYSGGLTTTSTYDAAGRLISISQGNSASSISTTHYTYDAANRLTAVEDAIGSRQWLVYDSAGRKVAEVDGAGSAVEYVYNGANQVIARIAYAQKLQVSSAPTLSAVRGLASVADRKSFNYYDAANRLKYEVDAHGAVTSFDYDAASRVTVVTSYATLINTASMTGGVAEFFSLPPTSAQDRKNYNYYDADGLLRANIDPEKYLTESKYDAAGRLVERIRYKDPLDPAAYTAVVGTVRNSVPIAPVIAAQLASYGTAWQFVVPAFTDRDGSSSLTYTAALANGNALPSWLSFNANTRTFSGTPSGADQGNVVVKVSAQDTSGAITNTTFAIEVARPANVITQARYVYVRKNDGVYSGLIVGELVVLDAQGNNVALGKSVTSSTPINDSWYDTTRAVDGNADSSTGGGYFSADSGGAWLQVDLGAMYDISAIQVHGIDASYADDKNGEFTVYTGAASMAGQTTTAMDDKSGVGRFRENTNALTTSITVLQTKPPAPVIAQARYVYVRKNDGVYSGLIVGELVVLDAQGNNLAAGKAVTSSTPMNDSWYDTTRAVDGNKDSHTGGGYFSADSGGGWLQVDLGAMYDISGIQVHGIDESYADDKNGEFTLYTGAASMAGQTTTSLDDRAGLGRFRESTNALTSSVTVLESKPPAPVITQARYVYVRKNDDVYTRLVVGELVVLDALGNNLAAGKPVVSSTPENDSWYDTSRAVDGNKDSHTGGGFFSADSGGGWLQVDLGAMYDIAEIQVHGIDESYADDKNGEFTVYTGATSMAGQPSSTLYDKSGIGRYRENTNALTTSVTVLVNRPVAPVITEARYVYIRKNDGVYTRLIVGEMVVLDAMGNNLALGKTVTSSAPENDSWFDTTRATDGNTDSHTGGGFYSAASGGGWLQIDLGAVYAIAEIQVHGIDESYAEDKNGEFTIYTGANSMAGQSTGALDGLTAIGRFRENTNALTTSVAALTVQPGNTALPTGVPHAADLPWVRSSSANDLQQKLIYNARDQLTGEIDALGYLTEYVYDNNGNQAQTVRYANALSTASLSAIQNGASLLSVRPAASAADQVTTRSYDALNRIAQETNAAGTVTTYRYDSAGNLSQTVIAANTAEVRSLTARYDVLGRLVGELSAEGGALLNGAQTQAQIEDIWLQYGVRHTYDAAGHRTATVDQNDNKTLFYYDGDGRQAYTINALGETTQAEYNAFGQIQARYRFGERIRLDGLAGGLVDSNLLQAVNEKRNAAKDSQVSYTYDANGRIASTVDSALAANSVQKTTTYGYNAFGDEISRQETYGTGQTLIQSSTYDHRGLQIGQALDPAGINATTQIEYDAFGRAIRSRDASGHWTTTEFDKRGRVISTTDTLNAKTSATYDAFDRVLTRTDALLQTTSYSYDLAQRSVSVTTPLGITVTTRSTRLGQTLSVTDGKGNTTRYEYDKDGALLQTVTPLNYTAQRYDKAGRLLETVDANGVVVHLDYDAANRVLRSVVDPTGLALTTAYAYDAKGQRVSVTAPNGDITRLEYNVKGELVRQTVDPSDAPGNAAGLNLTTVFAYDGRGETVRIVDPNGIATVYTYDALGRRTQEVRDPSEGSHTGLNLVRSYTYDVRGNLSSATDANGHITRYAYDNENRLRFSLDAAGSLKETAYDAIGQVVRETTFATAVVPAVVNGLPSEVLETTLAALRQPDIAHDTVSHYVYDADGRVTSLVDGAGSVVKFAYDANGNTVERTAYATRVSGWVPGTVPAPASSPSDMVSRTIYDALDRARYVVDGTGAVTAQKYDGNGNIVERIAYATPVAANTTYTLASIEGAVSAIKDTAHDAADRFVFDAANRRIWHVDGTGAATQAVYDANGNVLKTIAYATAISPQASPVGLGRSALDRVTVATYDHANRKVYEVDAQGSVRKFRYDRNGNAIEATSYAQAFSVPAVGDSFDYSLVESQFAQASGNRVSKFIFDAANRLAFAVDGLGAVTEQVFDAAGNTIKTVQYAKTISSSGLVDPSLLVIRGLLQSSAQDRISQRVLNAADRLVYAINAEGSVSRNEYDGAGRVLSSTRYANPVAASASYSAGTIASAVAVDAARDQRDSFSYDAAGRLIASTDAAGYTERYELNALGQKLKFTNKLGSTWNYAYDAAGRLVQETSPKVTVAATALDSTGKIVVDEANSKLAEVVTRLQYDALGNLVARTEAQGLPEQRTTRYEYDQLGRQIRTLYAPVGVFINDTASIYAGSRTESLQSLSSEVRYDALGNAVFSRDVAGNVSYKTYDRLGRESYEVDARGYVTGQTYNSFGEVIRTARFANATGFAGSGATALTSAQVESAVNGAGIDHSSDRAIVREYDRAGRVSQITEPATYTYDSSAPVGAQYAISQKITRHTYNAFGEVVKTEALKNAGRNEWVATSLWYDRMGRQIATVDALGYLTIDGFDGLGNQKEHKEYATAIVGWSSGTAGELPAVDSANDRITHFTYDRLNRKTAETRLNVRYSDTTQTAAGASTAPTLVSNLTTAFAYDALGNLTITTDALGAATYTAYDALGRTASVQGPSRGATGMSPLTQFFRDAHGNVDIQIESQLYNIPPGQASNPQNGGALVPGQTLLQGQSVTSTNGRFELVLLADGNVAVRDHNQGNKILWNTQTANSGADRVVFEPSGRLALYAGETLIMATASAGLGGVSLRVQQDGNVVLLNAANETVWSTGVVISDPASSETRRTYFRYDVLGRLVQTTDAAGSSISRSYNAEGKVAKQWQIASGDGIASQTIFELYKYDQSGNLIQTITPASISQLAGSSITVLSQESAGVNTTAVSYNAFGEATSKSVNGLSGLDAEHWQYDNAGRVWRTNAGDGIERVSLYDLLGRKTAEIQSAGMGRSNQDPAIYNAYSNLDQVAQAADVRRTDIKYDALGRMTEQRGPERSETQGGVSLISTQTSWTIQGSSKIVAQPMGEDGVLYAWTGLNSLKIDVSSSLAALGSGELKVVVSYMTPSYERFNDGRLVPADYPPPNPGDSDQRQPVSGAISVHEEVLTGSTQGRSVLLSWADPANGPNGIHHVTNLKLYKRDATGVWQELISQEASGTITQAAIVAAPSDPDVITTIEVRSTSTGDWIPKELINFGQSLRINLSELPPATYEYRVFTKPVNEAARITSTGTLTVGNAPVQHPLVLNIAVGFNQPGVGDPAVFAWQSPGPDFEQTLRGRHLGEGWEWHEASYVGNGYDGIDLGDLDDGHYEYELVWTRKSDHSVYAKATGTFFIQEQKPAVVTSHTSGGEPSPIAVTLIAPNGTGSAIFQWNAPPAGVTQQVYGRPINSTGPWDQFNSVTVGNLTQVDVSGFTYDAYDYEIRWTQSGDKVPYAKTSGRLNISPARAGVYWSSGEVSINPATSLEVKFENGYIKWPITANYGLQELSGRVAYGGNGWTPLPYQADNGYWSFYVGDRAGLYEYQVKSYYSGETLPYAQATGTVNIVPATPKTYQASGYLTVTEKPPRLDIYTHIDSSGILQWTAPVAGSGVTQKVEGRIAGRGDGWTDRTYRMNPYYGGYGMTTDDLDATVYEYRITWLKNGDTFAEALGYVYINGAPGQRSYSISPGRTYTNDMPGPYPVVDYVSVEYTSDGILRWRTPDGYASQTISGYANDGGGLQPGSVTNFGDGYSGVNLSGLAPLSYTVNIGWNNGQRQAQGTVTIYVSGGSPGSMVYQNTTPYSGINSSPVPVAITIGQVSASKPGRLQWTNPGYSVVQRMTAWPVGRPDLAQTINVRALDGNVSGVDLLGVLDGQYRYTLEWFHANNMVNAFASASGDVIVTAPAEKVFSQATNTVTSTFASTFGPAGSGQETVLSWIQPPLGVRQVVRGRHAGGDNNWEDFLPYVVTTNGISHVDMSNRDPGNYEYEISWLRDNENNAPTGQPGPYSQFPYAWSHGTFNILSVPGVYTSAPAASGAPVVSTVSYKIPLAFDPALAVGSPDVVSWQSPPAGVNQQLYGRGIGGTGEWIAIAIVVSTDGYTRMNASAIPAHDYEYELSWTRTGETQAYARAAGVVSKQDGTPPRYSLTNTVVTLASNPTPPPISSTPAYDLNKLLDGDTRWIRPIVEQKFDRWGNVVETNDPRSLAWKSTYEYNQAGQLIARHDPNTDGIAGAGGVTTWYYDAVGRQVGVQDANGHLNTQLYDSGGNVVEERHADGGIQRYDYNGFGDKTSAAMHVTDSEGQGRDIVTRYGYDAVGRLISTTTPGIQKQTVNANMGVDSLGPVNVVERNEYDSAGRLLRRTNGNQEITNYRYDAQGRVIATIQPMGQESRTAYDEHGRVQAETDANGSTATWKYNAFGQLNNRTTIGGTIYQYQYDYARQLIAQTSNGGERVSYAYDAAGQVISIENVQTIAAQERVNTTTYRYDLAGHRVQEKTVQDAVVYQDNRLAYDALGRLRLVQDGRGKVDFEYDAVGNKLKWTTHYDVPGMISSATPAVRTFTYDAMNRQTRIDAVDITGAPIGAESHVLTYDQAGNRTSDTTLRRIVTTVDATHNLQGFDQNNQPIFFDTGTSYTSRVDVSRETYRYDGLNRLSTVVRDNVLIDMRAYDMAGRLLQTGTNGLLPVAYTVELNHNVQLGLINGQDTRVMQYDANGRLMQQRVIDSAGIAVQQDTRYTGYDAAGNLTDYKVNTSNSEVIYHTNLQKFDGYREGTTTATRFINGNYSGSSTSSSAYDAGGGLIALTDSGQTANNRSFVNDAQGRTLYSEQGGRVSRQIIANGEVIGSYGQLLDPVNPRNGEGILNLRAQAEFGTGYQAISGSTPRAQIGSYTVANGDSLQSIAFSAYGDSRLWYRIADANGLGGDRDLRVGQSLAIPSQVGGTYNSSSTVRPYDPSVAVGDTSPTLPMPSNGQGGCGGMGQIILIAIVAIAAVYTAGLAASAGMFGSEVAAAVTTGAGTGTFGGTMVAGSAVLGGEVGFTAAVAAGAVGGAVGSIAGQAFGLATGMQSEFSWKGVALSALSGGAGAGLGSLMSAGGFLPGSSPAMAAVRSAVGNAFTQGVGVLTGLQKQFDWKGVAASAAGGAVGQVVGNAAAGQWGTTGLGGLASRSLAGFAAGTAASLVRGGRVVVQQVATDAFGNALAGSLASGNGQSSWAMLGTQEAQLDQVQTAGDFARMDGAEYRSSPYDFAGANAVMASAPDWGSTGSLYANRQAGIQYADASSVLNSGVVSDAGRNAVPLSSGGRIVPYQGWGSFGPDEDVGSLTPIEIRDKRELLNQDDFRMLEIKQRNLMASEPGTVFDTANALGDNSPNEARRLSNYPSREMQLVDYSNQQASAFSATQWKGFATEYKAIQGSNFTRDSFYNGLWTKGAQLDIAAGNTNRGVFDEMASVAGAAGAHADVGLAVGRGIGQGIGNGLGNVMGMAGRKNTVAAVAIGANIQPTRELVGPSPELVGPQLPLWKGPIDYGSILKDGPKIGSGKPFTAAQKLKAEEQNKIINDGLLRSDASGRLVERSPKSQSGVATPSNAAQFDHKTPRRPADAAVSPGSNSFKNLAILTSGENRAKSNK